eukprot:1176369-Prorocentrum_minimum.AAC.4
MELVKSCQRGEGGAQRRWDSGLADMSALLGRAVARGGTEGVPVGSGGALHRRNPTARAQRGGAVLPGSVPATSGRARQRSRVRLAPLTSTQ